VSLMAKQDPKAPPATAAQEPTPAQEPKAPRFRLWANGGLHCNGVVFKAGEELPMAEAEIVSLGLMDIVERIPE